MNKSNLTNEQKAILEEIKNSDRHYYISGAAGTGKSTVIHALAQECQDKNLVICAPTGLAALNVEGITLHSLTRAKTGIIPPYTQPVKDNVLLDNADIVVVDEISMCRCDMFSFLVRSIKESERRSGRKKQLIVMGDFFQLPPVVTKKDRPVIEKFWGETAKSGLPFLTDKWVDCNFTNLALKKQVRQEDCKYMLYADMLKRGFPEVLSYFNQFVDPEESENRTLLCPTKAEADEYNAKKLEAIEGEVKQYQMIRTGTVDKEREVVQQVVSLKVGARVMTLRNDYEEDYRNGSRGVVTELCDDHVVVQLDNGKTVTVYRHTWHLYGYEPKGGRLERVIVGTYNQIPLRLMYALTIHKSQGLTLGKIAVNPGCFAPGQLYTAITRVRQPEDIVFTREIKPADLKVSPEVEKFDKVQNGA